MVIKSKSTPFRGFVVETVDVGKKLSSSLKLWYNIYVVYLWLTPYGSTLGLDARQERICLCLCLCLFQSGVFRLCGHTQPTCFNKCFSHCGGSQACPIGMTVSKQMNVGSFKKTKTKKRQKMIVTVSRHIFNLDVSFIALSMFLSIIFLLSLINEKFKCYAVDFIIKMTGLYLSDLYCLSFIYLFLPFNGIFKHFFLSS